ncbi:D-alanine--D-alanine ligase family protein [Gryllotalpicola protaetiae]|uniref:D-alanine--D-alanine ligase n=1 Tax=Gryllotalpicola protaetiae TaxID=2419771 RepID=A0A387BMN5_9MICO|nr:D-alanine--D-alanine ligase [Gryllotalpicola protaetiae]AYG05083.1 D-alanine--D-alanine ligase [Gryllotalpicola protaetiae]
MTARTRVAVIGGGANGEHEVSLASAAAAVTALDPQRYDPISFTIGRDGAWLVAGEPLSFAAAVAELSDCDVVLPLVHGAPGEDGTLAALCELAGVRYVGSGVGAGALAIDKHATKLIAQSVGLRTAAAALLTPATRDAYGWSGPVVVKPAGAGSSRGVTAVHEASELARALDAAFAWDARVLVEDMIIGREIDIAVFEPRTAAGEPLISPPLEIRSEGIFDYDAKYGDRHSTDVVFEVPARLTSLELRRLEQGALALYRALGCRGVARLDFFLARDGWVLNEVNTVPGFTAVSQVPQMLAAAGIAYPDLLDLLIQEALA